MEFGRRPLLAAAVSALALAFGAGEALAQQRTELRIFVGGQQRPEVWERVVAAYEQRNPGIDVVIEVGGATSEAQQQYLSTVLTSRDPALDLILIDVVRPAQYAAAGWAEPLDGYFRPGEKEQVLSRVLPAYAEANQVDGRLYALPSFADALFLYYRTDLFEKYGLQPPKTWEEARAAARRIQQGENNPNLQGISFQGAPIEGTVCTFLVPFWSAGGQLTDASGNVTVDNAAGRRSLQLWTGLKNDGIAKASVAEVRTDDTRLEFQAGNVAMAVLWAYGWNHFQSTQGTQVAGKVGVVPLPALEGGQPATCIGGWQWAMSAFSAKKQQAFDLLRYLTSEEASKTMALAASNLPVYPSVYQDAEVLAANPWFAQALPVVRTARSRPVSANYAQVSDIIRTNMNAVLAGTKTADEALSDMQGRLRRAIR
jgi:multiple sugar transport system substrate-binding protein